MKLSIITINYNNKSGLKKTMDSVINQSFKDFEYIVIDGGSSDGSKEAIELNSDLVTYWVSEKDTGIYNAMNKGIIKAKGEYCMFLNSGDWLINENVLLKIFSLNLKEDIIYGNVLKVSPLSSEITYDKGFQRSELSLGDMLMDMICHQSMFVKRELFKKYGLYNEEYRVASDWAFLLKVIGLENVPVKYIDIDIAYFDVTGISNNDGGIKTKEREIELKKTLPERVYKDYLLLAEYRWKVRSYDKIVSHKPIWYLISIYNKLFGRPLW